MFAGKAPKRPAIVARWSRAPVPAESPETPPARRDRMVDAIVQSMRDTALRQAKRRRLFIQFGFAAAMAGILVLGSLGWRARTASEPIAAHLYTLFGSSHAVAKGRELISPSPSSSALPLAFSSQIATERASSSRLQLVSGVDVTVGPETRLTLPATRKPTDAREELSLELGFIRVEVPKLPTGHFFAIRTPNALVTVHGTAFSIEVTKSELSASLRTSVVVANGIVTVDCDDRRFLLSAGMQWASTDQNASATASASRTNAALESSVPAHTRRVPSKTQRGGADGSPTVADSAVSREAAANQTQLASQNRLFSDAMNARDRGDRSSAVRLLDDFVRFYPASPLAQDAHVERIRMLSQMGDPMATARAARTYLTLYPNGFAREEARELALESRTER